MSNKMHNQINPPVTENHGECILCSASFKTIKTSMKTFQTTSPETFSTANSYPSVLGRCLKWIRADAFRGLYLLEMLSVPLKWEVIVSYISQLSLFVRTAFAEPIGLCQDCIIFCFMNRLSRCGTVWRMYSMMASELLFCSGRDAVDFINLHVLGV